MDGLLDQSLSFDGSSTFVTLPHLPHDDLRDFTVATWVWQDAEANWQRIFDFGSGTENYMMMTLVNGVVRFDICRNGVIQFIETEGPALDRWAHVAITFSGNWANPLCQWRGPQVGTVQQQSGAAQSDSELSREKPAFRSAVEWATG